MAEPLETAELLAFAEIVEAKSLSAAAATLRVPRATISRRLARLEERLATRLLRRTTRSLVLTDAGEVLHRHARIVLDAVRNAEASVRRTDDVVRGDLRVSAPPLTSQSFAAMICAFANRYPEVRLQVHLSTQVVDLARGDYDVAIRASTELQPGLVARTLARDAVIAVASPSYLAKSGIPRTRNDLRHHRCLMGFARGEVPQTHWGFAGGKLHVDGVFFSNDVPLLCAAALNGLGIAFLPGAFVNTFVASGQLVQVLPGALEAKAHFAVVYLEREFIPAPVRAFVDEVVAWAETGLTSPMVPTVIEEACKEAGKRSGKEASRLASRQASKVQQPASIRRPRRGGAGSKQRSVPTSVDKPSPRSGRRVAKRVAPMSRQSVG